MINKNRTLSLRGNLGYGIASMGDTIIYNLLTVYLLFFLTDIAMVGIVMAGTIIFIANICNAVAIIAIGYVSDRYVFKSGRRIPYMMTAIIPIVVLTIMVFTVINTEYVIKLIYYTVTLTVLWTAHSTYVVPYEALGAELTSDSSERTILRSYARFFMSCGNMFGLVLMLYIIEKLESAGLTSSRAWQLTAIFVALIAGITFLATCLVLRKTAVRMAKPIEKLKSGICREYFEILKIKPFIHLLWITFSIVVANVFSFSSIVYFMTYNLRLSESLKSIVFLVITIAGMVITPIYANAAKKFDKKYVMITGYLFAGAMLIFISIIGVNSFFTLCLTLIVFTVGTSAYWQLSYSMSYDISDLDEYKNGRRREGIIMSLVKIFSRIANAIAVQFFAWVLYLFGYAGNHETQSDMAMLGISLSLSVIPAILFAAAALSVYLYPISEKKHNELIELLKLKNIVKS